MKMPRNAVTCCVAVGFKDIARCLMEYKANLKHVNCCADSCETHLKTKRRGHVIMNCVRLYSVSSAFSVHLDSVAAKKSDADSFY